jgi:ATP/maltotriose-dependent transcriptional regulator MalT
MGWLTTPSEGKNVLWLYGVAGSGKSTIATTVAKHFRSLHRLGAFLLFDRKANSDPSNVIQTLAYRLGSFDPRIGAVISAAISSNSEFDTSSLAEQFSVLLGPLSTLKDLQTEGPIVVVLDALDECGTPQSRESLLKMLAEEAKKLPPFIRIFITSRNEHDINLAFSGKANICAEEFQISAEGNQVDIMSYLRHQLGLSG